MHALRSSGFLRSQSLRSSGFLRLQSLRSSGFLRSQSRLVRTISSSSSSSSYKRGRMARNVTDGIDLYWESFGNPNHPTLLLINGLGSQCIRYEDEWCRQFAARDLHVVRFDNRDVGYSSRASQSYDLSHMAADAVAVLDDARCSSTHCLGLSLGGMIAQTLAVEHTARLKSLISVMSTTGEREFGTASPAAAAALGATPDAATDGEEAYIETDIRGLRVWGTPAYQDEARWREVAQRSWARSPTSPDALDRQFRAMLTSADERVPGLRRLDRPTLIMHGDADSLISESGGRRTAALIPGAKFVLLEGLGHDYPPQVWPLWVRIVADFVGTVERRQAESAGMQQSFLAEEAENETKISILQQHEM